jgi:phage-related tail protein
MVRLGDDFERKKTELDQLRTQFDRERKTLAEKLETTKKKLSESQDEAMRQKLDFGREQALSK